MRALWNSLVAGVVFQHPSVESLRRELVRNAQLRELCGFLGPDVPPASSYTRFLGQLMTHQTALQAVFETLVDHLAAALPDLVYMAKQKWLFLNFADQEETGR